MSALAALTLPEITALMRTTMTTDCQPWLLLGSPGTAKTSFCRTLPALLADVRGLDPAAVGLLEFNCGQRDAVDTNGLGLPAKGSDGRWRTHSSLSMIITAIEATGKEHGVLILDEATQCGADMQKSLRSVMDPDTRTSGGDKLPDGWIVVATGNRLSDKSGSQRALSHVANAVIRCEVLFDFESYRDWCIGDGMHPLLIACAQANVERGLFVDAVPAEDVQFSSPRSYSRLARNLTAMAAQADGVIPDNLLTRKLAESTIGREATDMVFSFIALHDKVPTDADIQRDPTGCLLPSETDLQYLASNVALASAKDSETADKALQYIVRLRADMQIGCGAALLRRSAREGWTCVGPTAAAFVAEYADVLPLTV